MDYYKESLKMHEEHKGKMAVASKVKVETKDDLSTAYTPGVAEPCRKIKEDPENVYKYTNKSNIVAVVSDGSAVLGLGNIGGLASIPVMDGKSLLFKEFAGIDAFPICLETQDVDEIVNIVKNIAPTLGGINLEDISAPRCFEIEEKLQAQVDIPVFHDDQHGTAVVVSAAVINAAKLTGRKLSDMTAVINGAGAAGTAIAKMLLNLGIRDIVACDSKGILTRDRGDLNEAKKRLAAVTNEEQISGSLADAVSGRDLFIGVSAAKVLTQDMVRSMNKDAIIFAMANPEPENPAGSGKGSWCGCCGNRTFRLSEPDQQRAHLPGTLQGCAGSTRETHHRRNENCCCICIGRDHPGRRTEAGLYHPECILSECCRHRSRRCGKSLGRIERQAKSTDLINI